MKADSEQVTNSGSLLVTHMRPHTESRANEEESLHEIRWPDPESPGELSSGPLLVTHMRPHTESRANEEESMHEIRWPDRESPESALKWAGCVLSHFIPFSSDFLASSKWGERRIFYMSWCLALGNARTTVSLRRHSKFDINGEGSSTGGSSPFTSFLDCANEPGVDFTCWSECVYWSYGNISLVWNLLPVGPCSWDFYWVKCS